MLVALQATVSAAILSPKFILLMMPVMCPYSLWNLKNYLYMTKSQFNVPIFTTGICLPSIVSNIINSKKEL